MSKNLSISGQSLYPHLKITNERFPRLLVTRKIERDGAAYFGAFLPETGVRFFLDFLNKLFKLRSCTIPIDGSFQVPCPQFYARRCLAPCVENLCDEKEYLERVELLRLFLSRENEILREKLLSIIEEHAEKLDFEAATEWRDKLNVFEDFWRKDEWILWLDKSTDSWEIERKDNEIFAYLVSMRGRKNLGKCVFVFENLPEVSDAEIIEQILPQFYKFHAPAEIRVSGDFATRKEFAAKISKRENHAVKITVVNENNQKITVDRAIQRNKFEFDFKNIKPPIRAKNLQSEIKKIFPLKKIPKRIEAFDVAHISGTNSVGANVVWENGEFLADQYKFWLLDETSELKTLEESIARRFAEEKNTPDLILIDGGSSQINAALKALKQIKDRDFFVISAVKPPGQHGEVSHFLTETNEKITFEADSEAFRFLQKLRDESHDFANSVHRTSRDFSHFYELAAVLPSLDETTRRQTLQKFGSIRKLREISLTEIKKQFDVQIAEIIWSDLRKFKADGAQKINPLIVPIRFDDPNGDARSLRPLQTYK